MENIHYISSDLLSIEMINEIVFQGKQLALSEEAIVNIEKCRKYFKNKFLCGFGVIANQPTAYSGGFSRGRVCVFDCWHK